MMNSFAAAIPPLLLVWLVLSLNGAVYCQRAVVDVVNVGAVFTFNSVIGRAAIASMEAAVSDVNADPGILNGTKLNLIRTDAECNAMLGSIKTFQLLEREVVALIGPQSSTLAHMISEIANGLQVPLVSYAATDPTLSALQFPFFLRTAQSDSQQMAAIADLIDSYGWKEIIAIFVDDEYGRNGISALGDELQKKMARISFKLPLPTNFDSRDINDLLTKSKLLGPRVYVVHVNPDPDLGFFTIAQELKMMTTGYVWFATDWLSTTLDSFFQSNQTSLKILQGVIGLRQYIPPSVQKKALLSQWRNRQHIGFTNLELNTYGYCAYDAVWAVAYSIDRFLREHNNVSFSSNYQLQNRGLSVLKVFNGGNLLLNKLMQTNFTGLTGQVQFSPEHNAVSGYYEIININSNEISSVGYWSNHSGITVSPLRAQNDKHSSYSRHVQKLSNISWPGGSTEKPRGWVIANEERPLRIAVPNRASFVEFATESSSHEMIGYCVDVFTEARKLVPYDVPCTLEHFGNGSSNPNYYELVKMVADDVYDGAIGDISIVTNRTKIADFTQPYVATGLVIVTPISNSSSSAWVFLKPFTLEMWCATGASFVIIAVVIWILEHRVNSDFRGPPRRQLVTMFLFSFSTLFKTNQEDTVSTLGRMVMVVWLFLLLVITSSYTASLTSILTVQQLSSPITGIDSLAASNLPIGYQVGSFAYSYLTGNLHVSPSRLHPLGSPAEYEMALRKGPSQGGVAAIVDELPYIELFLSKQTDFGILGQPFTRNGWGFVFHRGSPLAIDMSTAILKLAESGKLQAIYRKWFCQMGCPEERAKDSAPDQLHLSSFWGLYLLCGVFTVIALLVFLVRTLRQFLRYKRDQRRNQMDLSGASPSATSTHCSEIVYSFFDFIDEKEEAIKKYFNAQPQVIS